MLRLDSVSASYGPVLALEDVSLEVAEGAVVAILGANGAGKSSSLRVASGLLRPTNGFVEFMGERIDRRSPEQIVARGISHVPEGRQLFTDMDVTENLRLGGYVRKDRQNVKRDIDRMFEYFPILAERRRQSAGSLSGGEQQMLAIARGLMSRPKALLLDEPSLGLAPLIVREIFEIINTINQEEGVTILLVEQNVSVALKTATYAYVLETGRVVVHDVAENLRENESVRKSYLGY